MQTTSRAEQHLLPSPVCAGTWRKRNRQLVTQATALMWFPRKTSATVWTGTSQQFHQTMLDWHIREKMKTDSSWICFPYLWVSWQMHRNNHWQLPKRTSFCYGCCKSRKWLLCPYPVRHQNFWFSTANWFQNLLITKIYKNILASIFMFENYSTSITEIL